MNELLSAIAYIRMLLVPRTRDFSRRDCISIIPELHANKIGQRFQLDSACSLATRIYY